MGTDFDKTCPSGAYISQIYGTQAGGVVAIAAQCTDGTNLGQSGGTGGEGRGPGDCQGGIDGVNIISSSSTIGRVGQTCNGEPNIPVGTGAIPNPQSTTFTCPAGQKIKGIRGKAAATVNGIQFFCDSAGWQAATPPSASSGPPSFVAGSPLAMGSVQSASMGGSPFPTISEPASSMGSALNFTGSGQSASMGSALNFTGSGQYALMMGGSPLTTSYGPASAMGGSPLATSSGGAPRSVPSSSGGAPRSAPSSSEPTECIADGEVSATTDGADCCSGKGVDEEGLCKKKGMSTAAIIGLVVFILLILGIIGYAAMRKRGAAAGTAAPAGP